MLNRADDYSGGHRLFCFDVVPTCPHNWLHPFFKSWLTFSSVSILSAAVNPLQTKTKGNNKPMKLMQLLGLSVALLCSTVAQADITHTTLYSYVGNSNTNGAAPVWIMEATDGNYYGITRNAGTTNGGSATAYGVIYKFDPTTSEYSVLHRFNGYNGQFARYGKLVQIGDTLYGNSELGGTNGGQVLLSGSGTIYKINLDGTGFQVIVDFTLTGMSNMVGRIPRSGLVASGDTLIGSTVMGGTNGAGSLFKIDTNGNFLAISPYNSASNPLDGGAPGAFTMGRDGFVYGTSTVGTNGNGALYKFTTNLTDVTVVANFPSDYRASYPFSGPVEGPNDGEFFGTTTRQRPNKVQFFGSVYKASAAGVTTLRFFTNDPPNIESGGTPSPTSELRLGPDGAMYGTFSSENAGAYTNGRAFRITTNGTYSAIYSFTNVAEYGYGPHSLNFASDGTILATTTGSRGGLHKLSVPMIPILKTIVADTANPGYFNVSFTSVAGQSYLVRTNAYLEAPNKGILATNLVATGGITTVGFVPMFNPERGFFDVAVENVPASYASNLWDHAIRLPQLPPIEYGTNSCPDCPLPPLPQ